MEQPKKQRGDLIRTFRNDFLTIRLKECKEVFLEIISSELIKYPDNLENIISLREMAKLIGVTHPTIFKWVMKYLQHVYPSTASIMYSEIWPPQAEQKLHEKQSFVRIIEPQIFLNYPDNVKGIHTITDLSVVLGIRRETAADWAYKYLTHKYGPKKGLKMYNTIWSSRQGVFNVPGRREVTFKRIELYIQNRGGNLITTITQFERMKTGSPDPRTIWVKDDKNHQFEASVHHLLYQGTWCPKCNKEDSKSYEFIYGSNFWCRIY